MFLTNYGVRKNIVGFGPKTWKWTDSIRGLIMVWVLLVRASKKKLYLSKENIFKGPRLARNIPWRSRKKNIFNIYGKECPHGFVLRIFHSSISINNKTKETQQKPCCNITFTILIHPPIETLSIRLLKHKTEILIHPPKKRQRKQWYVLAKKQSFQTTRSNILTSTTRFAFDRSSICPHVAPWLPCSHRSRLHDLVWSLCQGICSTLVPIHHCR